MLHGYAAALGVVAGDSVDPETLHELVLEAQRGFLYLAQKHAPEPVVEGLRLLMLFEGFSKSRIDLRPQYRSMWKQL